MAMGHGEGGGEGRRSRWKRKRKKRLVYAAAMAMGNGEGGGESRRGRRERKRRRKKKRRQKIEMKSIRCHEERHVCFSNRRVELIIKATELCVLTGAQLAIIVFSPSGMPCYSFAHPSMNTVIERYVNPSAASAVSEATRPAIVCDFESEFKSLCEALEAEALRRDELDAAARAAGVWTSDDDVPDRAREMEEAMIQQNAATGYDYDLGDDSLTADGWVLVHQGAWT